MTQAHTNMGVTNGEFDAFMEDLVAVLDDFKVGKAEQDELLSLLRPMREDIAEETRARSETRCRPRLRRDRLCELRPLPQRFTVQITPTQDGGGGPPGTQQLTITIGTGYSDRPVMSGAGWNGHPHILGVNGYDANVGALWSVSVTSTGRVIISNQLNVGTPDGHVGLRYHGGDPCELCDLTVTNNLGFSGMVLLGLPQY